MTTDPLGLRVLVVEDVAANQRLTQRLLEHLSCSVEVVDSGRQALAALAAVHFDVVVMDVDMPGMDGLEVTRRLRADELARAVARTPVIGVTAHVTEDIEQQCRGAGMDGYLPKPFRIETLARALRTATLAARAQSSEAPAAVVAPALSHIDDGAALDAATLAMLRSIATPRGTLLTEMIEIFLADLERRLDALAAAAQAQRAPEVARLAHALAGSAEHVGAMPLGGLCRELEAAAQSGSGDLSQRLGPIRHEAARAAAALAAAL